MRAPSPTRVWRGPRLLDRHRARRTFCASRLSHVSRHRYVECTDAAASRRLLYLLSVALVEPRLSPEAQAQAYVDLRELARSHPPAARWLCFAALGRPWNVWGVRPHPTDCDGFARSDHPLGQSARGRLALRFDRTYAAHRIFGRLRTVRDPAGAYGLGRLAEQSADPLALDLYVESANGGYPLGVIRAAALLPPDDAIALLTPWAKRGLVPAQALLAARLTQQALVGQGVGHSSRWRGLWADASPLRRALPTGSVAAQQFSHAFAWSMVVLRSHALRDVPGYSWAHEVARDLKYRFIELLPEHAQRGAWELLRARTVAALPAESDFFSWVWTEWESVCIDASEPCQVAGVGGLS